MSIFKAAFCSLLVALAAVAPAPAADQPAQRQHWVAAWSAAADQGGPALSGKTIRQVVRPSAAGSSVRLRLSNLYGTAAVTIGPVRIAKHAGESAIQSVTDRAVTFGGQADRHHRARHRCSQRSCRLPARRLRAGCDQLVRGRRRQGVHTARRGHADRVHCKRSGDRGGEARKQ